jgi:predicted metal-dependent HD superfamily phosphohydrolase
MKIRKALKVLRKAAKALYLSNGMEYHNWEHAKRVRRTVRTLYSGPEIRAVVLAADWHDAFYIPGSVSGLNEQGSSDLLNGAYSKIRDRLKGKKQKKMDAIVIEASTLVCSTSVDMHLYKGTVVLDTLAALLDADLCALADNFDEFCTTQSNILIENGASPFDIANLQKSSEFLFQFLSVREFIFHTTAARERFEVAAKDNINRYIAGANSPFAKQISEHMHDVVTSDEAQPL